VDVGTGPVARLHCEILSDRFLETSGLDGDRVVSDREKREAVVAGAVGLVSALLVGSKVGEGDRGVGNNRACGIGDRSENISSGQLSELGREWIPRSCSSALVTHAQTS
jgi:hypothetical protein